MSRTLAIGDIHGCLTALDTLLGFVQPSAADRLVFLGDYVDRGPDSKGVLGRLIELKRTRDIVCLRGNHEIMMAGARGGWNDLRFWTQFGGVQALDSYASPENGATLQSVPHEHWRFLEECQDLWETDERIFVHANLHPDLPLDRQPTEYLHWQFLSAENHRPHCSGKTMICGHSEQRQGKPLVLERAICIDTNCFADGWLTCLDVGSGKYWQANEIGATKEGVL